MYGPGQSPEGPAKVDTVALSEFVHTKVYPGEPPAGVTVAPPVQAVHEFLIFVMDDERAVGALIVMTVLWIQELASVMVATNDPTLKVFATPVVFVTTGEVLKLYT